MVDAIAEAEGISMSSVNFKAHFGKGLFHFLNDSINYFKLALMFHSQS